MAKKPTKTFGAGLIRFKPFRWFIYLLIGLFIFMGVKSCSGKKEDGPSKKPAEASVTIGKSSTAVTRSTTIGAAPKAPTCSQEPVTVEVPADGVTRSKRVYIAARCMTDMNPMPDSGTYELTCILQDGSKAVRTKGGKQCADMQALYLTKINADDATPEELAEPLTVTVKFTSM